MRQNLPNRLKTIEGVPLVRECVAENYLWQAPQTRR